MAADQTLISPAALVIRDVPTVEDFPPILRRHTEPDTPRGIGKSGRQVLAAFNRVVSTDHSEALLLWPEGIEGNGVFHGLAALERIGSCDAQGLATLIFPWNRNSGLTQRSILVDKSSLVKKTLPSLNRALPLASKNPALGYLMALHSLGHLPKGLKSKRWTSALARDPSLAHPTLLEIMPYRTIQNASTDSSQDNFLHRLRRYTWIKDREEYIQAAGDPKRTPFFLFCAHPSALSAHAFRIAGLDQASGGRRPDIVILDLMRRPRNSLGSDWRKSLDQFIGALSEAQGNQCPPILAVTDDIFALETLRWKVLNAYDDRRGRSSNAKLPSRSQLVLNAQSDVLSTDEIVPAALGKIVIEVYGTDLANFVESGWALRRSLSAAGSQDIADAVSAALHALQNIVALPGPPRQFNDFLVATLEGYERDHQGMKFDHLKPRGQIASTLKLGLAGSHHAELERFLKTYDELCSAAFSNNSGARLFDESLQRLIQSPARSLVAFSRGLIRDFAESRVETDEALAAARSRLGHDVLFVDRREAAEELALAGQGNTSFERILLVQPHAEDLLHLLMRPTVPKEITVLTHLAAAGLILRRIEVLLGLEGVEPVKANLLALQGELERAISGRLANLPDLEMDFVPSRSGTLDLTAAGDGGAGVTRVIQTSEHLTIRAYDGSDVAVYNPDALQGFSRRAAKDLRPGDQICVFSPEFTEAAREKLNLTADASEVLNLYHRTVAEAASRLPGQDMTAKAESLRRLILKIDPSLPLPGTQSLRQWIDVADLIDAPRSEVRPQAPQTRPQYFCFMKALGISDEIARHYGDFGVFWTRSARRRSGTAFHQMFMAILIDPHGVISRLPAARHQEVWRIYETAEQHVITVTSNRAEGGDDEAS